MKDVELKLIVELMKNSRRSDRELAKALKVSQPTISRTIRKLEKEGLIREYTAIPDFYRLGFDLMSVNFVKFKPNTTPAEIEKMKKTANELESESGIPSILVMNGMGLDSDRILIMFHRDYSSYSKFVDIMKNKAQGSVGRFESFLVDLQDKLHYKPLTMSALARFMSRNANESKRET